MDEWFFLYSLAVGALIFMGFLVLLMSNQTGLALLALGASLFCFFAASEDD